MVDVSQFSPQDVKRISEQKCAHAGSCVRDFYYCIITLLLYWCKQSWLWTTQPIWARPYFNTWMVRSQTGRYKASATVHAHNSNRPYFSRTLSCLRTATLAWKIRTFPELLYANERVRVGVWIGTKFEKTRQVSGVVLDTETRALLWTVRAWQIWEGPGFFPRTVT